MTEQRYCGDVTGRETLSNGIRGVQAGEIVTIDESQGIVTDPSRYFTYQPGDSSRHPDFKELDRVLIDCFERLIDVADGRPILLGLSAGYDSRLVALMLSRLGYDNIHCYTRYRSSEDYEEFYHRRAACGRS